MIVNKKPLCDECKQELQALTEAEALEDYELNMEVHGWGHWPTAQKHYCNPCFEQICEEINFPPCGICETHPCERGRECWANPPLHLFPYETYYANKVEVKA